MKNIKGSFRSNLTAGFLGIATLASTAGSALAGSQGYWKPPGNPEAPEVGTWIIAAGIVALLGLDLARRKFARKAKGSAS